VSSTPESLQLARCELDVVLRFSGRTPHELVHQFELLLTELPETDHEQRSRVYGLLAAAHTADSQAAAVAAARATDEARLAASTIAHSWARFARCVSNLTPELAQQRAEDAAAILAADPAPGIAPLVPTSYFMLLGALTELGRIAELDRALDPGGEILRRHPSLDASRYAAWFRCVRATLDGRTDEAEQLAIVGFQLAEQAGDPDGLSVQLGQLAVIRWMDGRAGELEPMLLQARQLLPDDVIWSATLAWVWLSQGRRSAARGLVSMLPSLETVPRDRNWLAALSILAVAVAQLEMRDLAAQILKLLGDFTDRLASIGLGVTVWGSVARPLALLQLLLGNVHGAIDLYREAIRVCTIAGAHAWLAEAQVELAALLVSPAGVDALGVSSRAADEAETLLSEAQATAHALQLRDLEQECAHVSAKLRSGSARSSVPSLANREHPAPTVRVLGTFTVHSIDGEVASWQSRKARELLKVLVASRGAPVHKDTMMDLLWPGVHPERLGNRLAVALVTVRRALDPAQRMHRSTFVSVTRESIRLCVERCVVDVEEWFASVDRAFAAEGSERVLMLAAVLDDAKQPVCADEPDAAWAEKLRREVRSRAFAAAYGLVEESTRVHDPLRAAEAYHWILEVDPYDQRAHRGLIETFVHMGALGHATSAKQEYERRMSELGLEAAM
jgi:DNA-binding SARP family transcriptional activator/cell division septum initiation protein DivIVA